MIRLTRVSPVERAGRVGGGHHPPNEAGTHRLDTGAAVPGHILIAPDKFKGSLTAPEVAEALASGVRAVRDDVDVRITPVADGGDGTTRAALAAERPGAEPFRSVAVQVTGPMGDPVDTEIAVGGDTGVVELAAASGLELLEPGEFAPMSASSEGTGELIRAALDAGARTIVVGVGGSACTDGGAGMLSMLGARILDEAGNPLPPGGGPLARAHRLDLSGLDERLADAEIVLASDVDNPLLGERGAARVYGPQKGAEPEQVESLEAALARWAEVVAAATGKDLAEEPGAGAAGGVGFGALAVLGATPRAGTDLILELVGFDEQLRGAALVVTGEGSLDEQTLHGKAPAGVSARAVEAGVPVVAVAGRCLLSDERLREAGFGGVHTVAELEPDPERSMREAATLLESVGERIAREWL